MKSRVHAVGLSFALAGSFLYVLAVTMAAWAAAPIIQGLAAHGMEDPSVVGAAVGELLVTVAVRSIAAFPALLLLTLSLVTLRYRSRWFFWILIATGWSGLLLVPVGTCFAVFFLVYGWKHRREFEPSKNRFLRR